MIYISGKITGINIDTAKANFEAAENFIVRYVQKKAINPLKLNPYNPDWKWEDYMVSDIRELFKCSGIYMLKNWGQSKGARVEYAIAR